MLLVYIIGCIDFIERIFKKTKKNLKAGLFQLRRITVLPKSKVFLVLDNNRVSKTFDKGLSYYVAGNYSTINFACNKMLS